MISKTKPYFDLDEVKSVFSFKRKPIKNLRSIDLLTNFVPLETFMNSIKNMLTRLL